MERSYCIYCRTNKYNGKEYIGKTCQSLKRRARPNGIGYTKGIFGDAIKEVGWLDENGNENFPAIILEEGLTKEQADEREKYYIKTRNTIYPNGYNLQDGGDRYVVHEITRKKHSEDMKGNGNPKYWKGKHFSDEHKKKVAANIRGRHWYHDDNHEVLDYEIPGSNWKVGRL